MENESLETILILLTIFAFGAGPFLMAYLALSLGHVLKPSLKRGWVFGIGLVAFAGFIVWSPWSFKGILIDYMIICGAYLMFCLAIMSSFFLRKSALKRIIITVGLLINAFGILMALGSWMVVSDTIPVIPSTPVNHYHFRVTGIGNATTSVSVTEVELCYVPPYLPFVEKELYSARLDWLMDVDSYSLRPITDNSGDSRVALYYSDSLLYSTAD